MGQGRCLYLVSNVVDTNPCLDAVGTDPVEMERLIIRERRVRGWDVTNKWGDQQLMGAGTHLHGLCCNQVKAGVVELGVGTCGGSSHLMLLAVR